jgi:pSer/pThr/pTyr-binding forkhead associated (FHA) protein
MTIELEKIVGLFIRDKKDQSIVTVLRHGDYSIGRAQDNDLTITNPTISSHHARIYTYLTASYIEDLNSTNGTFVDGKRVTKHILKPGNVIKLGEYELLLEERQPEVALRASL